jgi:hypothetical protein
VAPEVLRREYTEACDVVSQNAKEVVTLVVVVVVDAAQNIIPLFFLLPASGENMSLFIGLGTHLN